MGCIFLVRTMMNDKDLSDEVWAVIDSLIVMANLCGLGSTYKGCTYKIRGDMLTADVCKGLDKLLIEEEQK